MLKLEQQVGQKASRAAMEEAWSSCRVESSVSFGCERELRASALESCRARS